MTRKASRTRRSPEEARRRILEAAEKRLVEGGPEAVRVQPLARDLGLTDAAIHYHFGSREELMTALLRFGGQRLRAALREALEPAVEGGLDLPAFCAAASDVFGGRGYSRLALWLEASGWREKGSGLFDELVAGIREASPGRSLEDARQLAALVALVLMAEPIFGDAARRSVSLPGNAAAARRFERFWVDAVEGWVGS